MELENYIVGIDFGTTYSCMSVWKDGGLVIIPNGAGERTTPSVVIFDAPDKVFVGEETLYHLPKNDSYKIYEIKRILGQTYNQIKNQIKNFPYKIVKEENGDKPMIEMKFAKNKIVKKYPEEIANLIIRKLLSNAEAFLGKKIYDVLITFPADFSEAQKNAVRFSAEQIQGIKVLQVINEPCAAILSFGFPKQLLENSFCPFNEQFSLVKQNDEEIHPMEEISRSKINISIFSNSLNNDDSNIIINNNELNVTKENDNLIDNSFLNNHNKEKMKIIVFDFGGGTYDVSLVYVENGKNFETITYDGDKNLGGSDLDNKLMDYSLKTFCNSNKYDEKILRNNYKLMQRLKRACEETKKYLSVKTEDNILIEDFYESNPLCCHITRSKFEELCKDLFLRLSKPLDSILEKQNLNNTDIDEIVLVGGSSKIPKVKSILQQKFPNVQINDQISPDEAVALGASIYAESLRRVEEDFWKDFSYIDKTGHSIGIETEDGTLDVIIPKDKKYPTSNFHFFSTAYNDQYTFDVNIYEGENKIASQNELIGRFTLEGIPKRPKGEVILKVTVKIEKNQSIKVTGFVKDGDIKKNLTILRNNQYPKIQNNENLILNINDLNGEERKKQSYIFEYSKNFIYQKKDKDKYDLIKKYNIAVIDYLDFLERKYNDTSSEKYLFLLEKLFKSYTYIFNTNLRNLVDLNEKLGIKGSIESFLCKISNKAPFRIKHLLNFFKTVKNEHFIERLEIIVFSMELLYTKAMNNLLYNEQNHHLLSKSLFEECLSISIIYIKDEELAKMDLDSMKKYKDIKEGCDKKIKLISALHLTEIKSSKEKGKLFNNESKLEKDDLSLLSYNLQQAVKTINNIPNLNNNEEALETKSFYLANIVKIEFLKKDKKINYERLGKTAQESISIANKLKKDCKKKDWYKEIVKLNQEINKIPNPKPAPPADSVLNIDVDDLDEKFMTLLDQGNEVLLKYILQNHPCPGYEFSEELIENYRKDKKKFLIDMRKKYNFNDYKGYYSRITDDQSNTSEVNDKILEYIDKMIDNL